MADTISPRSNRGAAGRAAFAASFPDKQSKSAYYREISQRANAGRLVLSSGEKQALGEAYRLLDRIARRAGFDATRAAESIDSDAA